MNYTNIRPAILSHILALCESYDFKAKELPPIAREKLADLPKEIIQMVENINTGYSWTFRFPNGFGASVIKHGGSYGAEADCWEVGVLVCRDGKWVHTETTPITNDVLGWQTDADVLATCLRIATL